MFDDPNLYLFVEQIAVGTLKPKDGDLPVEGIKLLSITRTTARELFENVVSAQNLTRELGSIEELRSGRGSSPPLDYIFQQPKERRAIFLRRSIEYVRPETLRQLESGISTATTVEEGLRVLSQIAEDLGKKSKRTRREKRKESFLHSPGT